MLVDNVCLNRAAFVSQSIQTKQIKAKCCSKAAGVRVRAQQEDKQTPEIKNSDQINEVEVVKGRRTAVVTGAVSVAFGVAYLLLVQVLDTRGSKLVPPPPEAFQD